MCVQYYGQMSRFCLRQKCISSVQDCGICAMYVGTNLSQAGQVVHLSRLHCKLQLQNDTDWVPNEELVPLRCAELLLSKSGKSQFWPWSKTDSYRKWSQMAVRRGPHQRIGEERSEDYQSWNELLVRGRLGARTYLFGIMVAAPKWKPGRGVPALAINASSLQMLAKCFWRYLAEIYQVCVIWSVLWAHRRAWRRRKPFTTREIVLLPFLTAPYVTQNYWVLTTCRC